MSVNLTMHSAVKKHMFHYLYEKIILEHSINAANRTIHQFIFITQSWENTKYFRKYKEGRNRTSSVILESFRNFEQVYGI